MKKDGICSLLFAGLLAALFLLGSCTQFFSASLAPWAARDQSKILPPLSAENVDELVMLAENNPDLSLELLKSIKNAVSKASPDDASSMQEAALRAAANATGLGHAVLNQIGNSADALHESNNAISLVVGSIDYLKNLQDVSSALESILPEPGTPAFDAFVEKASPEDLAVAAALVLLAAEAQTHNDGTEYLKNFKPNDPSATLTPQEKYAVALAEAAVGKGMDDGPLKSLLSGLNLTKDTGGPDEPDDPDDPDEPDDPDDPDEP
jgi:hypothetical protein